MSGRWVPTKDGCFYNVNGRPWANVLSGAGYYQAWRCSTKSERRYFATLGEAKTWCEQQFKLHEVEDALDGKRRDRSPIQYFPAFLSAASTVPSGSIRVNAASSIGTAP
jgi:hypothetical protein